MTDLPDLPRTEIAIIELTNAFRRSERLGLVKSSPELTATARAFAQYLARTGKFAHEADGRQPADRAKAHGYLFCMVAENLAQFLDSRGFTHQSLASQMMDGWKASPGHRKNLVAEHVTDIGVGLARVPDKNPKYVSVQLFGRPAHLKTEFVIENAAGTAVTYSIAGQGHSIGPRYRVTHTSCGPSPITFERAGGWLTGTHLGVTRVPSPGMILRIVDDGGGRIQIVQGAGPAPLR